MAGRPLISPEVYHTMNRKTFIKQFSDYEKGVVVGHVEAGWGARRISEGNNWKRSSGQDYVTNISEQDNEQSNGEI